MSPADTLFMAGKHPLRVVLCGHRGRVNVDIRYQYQPKEGGALRPGFRGVSLPAETLPEVIEALEKIKAQLLSDGALTITGANDPIKFNASVYPRDF